MLSWIFRHRSRLGVIYGISPVLPVPAQLAAPAPRDDGRTGSETGYAPARGEASLAPGDWARRSRYVVMRPMHPDVG